MQARQGITWRSVTPKGKNEIAESSRVSSIRGVEIVTATQTPVLFTPAELPVEVAGPLTPAAPFVAHLKTAPVRAGQSTGAEVELAEVVTRPSPAEMKALVPESPGSQPLISLCGLFAAPVGRDYLCDRG